MPSRWSLTMKSSILFVLATVAGVWSGPLRVIFGRNQCAVRGASAVIQCQFDYPFGHIVTEVSWSKGQQISGNWVLVPLTLSWNPLARYQYMGNQRGDCRLKINDVQSADAGNYFFSFRTTLADFTSETSAQLSVKDPPDRVTLSISPARNVIRGTSVVLTCAVETCNPVRNGGYILYREGRLVGFGQNHTIADVQPGHSGRYQCQAWNSISSAGMDTFHSPVVLLQVYYSPVNISIWMDPVPAVWGSSVNLSCSSTANPPVENYFWYRRTDPGASSGLQVGSGQVLHISSMDASLSGLYHCQARNLLGEKNSTEVLLAVVEEEEQSSLTLPMLAGLGLAVMVALAFALFLFLRKKRSLERKKAEQDFGEKQPENEFSCIYANIHRPSSPLPDIYLQQPSYYEQHSRSSMGSEVTYSSVNIKSRGWGRLSDCPDAQGSRSNGENNADCVIYASVKTS